MNLFKFRQPDSDVDEEYSVEGERDLSSVNKGISLQNRIISWTIMAAACVLVAVVLYKYYANLYGRYKQAEVPTKDVTRVAADTPLPPLTMPDPEPTRASAAEGTSDALPPLQKASLPLAEPVAAANGELRPKSLVEIVRERRLKPQVRFNLESGNNAVSSLASPSDVGGASNSSAPSVLNTTIASAATSSAVHSSFAAARAYLLPDPTLMMSRGMAIPCTVIPAIDTTLTGVVTCVTGEDATGADNKVSLMDRGTLCIGQQSGGVVRGQSRVGIIWQSCETPQHVRVPLEAVAVDPLGRPGIPGAVDNHFWDRFGAAIALSLISDVGPYLIATRQGGSNNTTIAFPTITGPQEVMTEVLKGTVNIPPTITASQGAQVLIYLAGDVDFRDVYQLERVR